MMVRTGIIVLSDKAFCGEREDRSGLLLQELIRAAGWEVEKFIILPDEKGSLKSALLEMADGLKLDLILTSGGTGLGPRDITPEATAEVVEREISGIGEALRRAGHEKTPTAVLSRGVAGTRKGTLIINLPGSPRAVEESWPLLKRIIPHALEVLQGRAYECGEE